MGRRRGLGLDGLDRPGWSTGVTTAAIAALLGPLGPSPPSPRTPRGSDRVGSWCGYRETHSARLPASPRSGGSTDISLARFSSSTTRARIPAAVIA